MTTILTILGTVLVFALIIFIHELGHYAAAKLLGMPVYEFAIGMGPAIFKKEKNGTLYSLRAIPLGGYCRLGEDEESEDKNAFVNQAAWKRITVLAAGGIMNLIAGVLICFLFVAQMPEVRPPIVETITAGGAAEQAGLLPGDEIIKINNTRTNLHSDVILKLFQTKEQTINVMVDRDGERLVFPVTPHYIEADEGISGRYVIGYVGAGVPNSFINTIKFGWYEGVFTTKSVFIALQELITGRTSAKHLSGPVGIVGEIGGAVGGVVTEGSAVSWMALMRLFLVISVNLGIFNLLPIPALDGGRITFILVELVRRKRMKPETEGTIHMIGFILLMMLVLFATTNDIGRMFRS